MKRSSWAPLWRPASRPAWRVRRSLLPSDVAQAMAEWEYGGFSADTLVR